MFVGHTAVALAAKKTAPEVSLGLLLAAAVWLDLVWPIFLLTGTERVRIDPGNTVFTPLDFTYYPWTHSLVMALAWSAAVAFVSGLTVQRPRSRLLLAALVFSHWVLDLIVHRPDLPLWPGASPKLGLGLWNSVPGTILVEGAMFVTGIWMYANDAFERQRWAVWILGTDRVLCGPLDQQLSGATTTGHAIAGIRCACRLAVAGLGLVGRPAPGYDTHTRWQSTLTSCTTGSATELYLNHRLRAG